MSTSITQSNFRFRNDNGNEANATWRHNEGSDITRVKGEKFRLRAQINTEGEVGPANFQLDYRYKIIKRNILEYSEDFDHIDWGKQGPVVTTPDATTAPNGSLTATKMDESDSYAQFMLFKHIYTFNDNEIVTISAYAKAAERDLFFIMLRPKSDHWAGVHFNLTTGTITHGTENFIDSGIESVGDGWYRVWATRSVGSGTNTPTIYYGIKIDTAWPHDSEGDVDYNGDSTAGLYIWGTQLERGSISDYQSTSGYEEFSDWSMVSADIITRPNITATSVTGTNAGADAETSVSVAHNHPGGMLLVFLRYNAANVNENSSVSFNGVSLTKQASIGIVPDGDGADPALELFTGTVNAADNTVTASFGVATPTRRALMVFSIANADGIRHTNTGYSDVAASGTVSNTVNTEEFDLVLQSCGWRLSASSVASYSSGQVEVSLDDSPSRMDSSKKDGTTTETTMSTTFTSNAPGTVARIGVSIKSIVNTIVVNLSESEYINSDATSVTTALLTAPDSTSVFTAGFISDDTNPLPTITLDEDEYTELEWSLISSEVNEIKSPNDFEDVGWSAANVVLTATSTTAPDGSLTATKMDETDVTAHFYLNRDVEMFDDNENITLSVYVKAAERDIFRLLMHSKSNAGFYAFFNLTLGTVLQVQGSNAGIDSVGNGWYRVWQSYNTGSGSYTPYIAFVIETIDAWGSQYAGDSTAGLYIWGAHLEINQPHEVEFRIVRVPPELQIDNFTTRTLAQDPIGNGWTQVYGTTPTTSAIVAITTPTGWDDLAWQMSAAASFRMFSHDDTLPAETIEILTLMRRDHATMLHNVTRLSGGVAYSGGFRNNTTDTRAYYITNATTHTDLGATAHGISSILTKWIWLRVLMDDTGLYYRVWEYGTAEPATWVSHTLTPVNSSGLAGLLHYGHKDPNQTYTAYTAIGTGGASPQVPTAGGGTTQMTEVTDSTANAVMTLVDNLGTVAIDEQWENVKDLTICIDQQWRTVKSVSICRDEMWWKVF